MFGKETKRPGNRGDQIINAGRGNEQPRNSCAALSVPAKGLSVVSRIRCSDRGGVRHVALEEGEEVSCRRRC